MIIFPFRSPLFVPRGTKLAYVPKKATVDLSSIPFFAETKNLTKDYDRNTEEESTKASQLSACYTNVIVVIARKGEDNACTCPRFSSDGGSFACDAGLDCSKA